MPILMASAARAEIMNGDAICKTPAAAAVFITVRRSSLVVIICGFMVILPRIFMGISNFLRDAGPLWALALGTAASQVSTLEGDRERTQGCRDLGTQYR